MSNIISKLIKTPPLPVPSPRPHLTGLKGGGNEVKCCKKKKNTWVYLAPNVSTLRGLLPQVTGETLSMNSNVENESYLPMAERVS